MMPVLRIFMLVCLVVGFCCQVPAVLAASVPEAGGVDGNIHIQADRMSRSEASGIYNAEGNVVVLWQESRLTADTVNYSTVDRQLHASGSVVLSKGPAVLKGKTLLLDTVSGRAEMDASQFTTPESGVVVTAEKLVRISDSQFTASTTELTTCDMPSPSWKFGADNLYVNTLGYATGRHVIFYVKDVPVLYLPWIAFPVVLEKRSGLLFPRFSKSTSRGYQFDLPVYWVISPSQDLQLDLDIMSRRGVGAGFDYRYIRERGSEGRIQAYPVYDKLVDRWRWQLAQEHTEVFSPTANLRMAVNATGDRSFFTDFGEKSGEYNRQANTTVVNGLKTWPNYAVTSYLAYSEDLYIADNHATVQTLPSLGIAGVRQALSPQLLYLDLDSSLENLYRDTAPRGQRLQVYPRMTMHLPRNSYFQTEITAGAHLRAYATDQPDSGSGAREADLRPEAALRLSTSVQRVYETGFDQLKKVRHELVPEVRYSYVPPQDQQRLPYYDFNDRMIHQNMVALSLTSFLNGKFVSEGISEYRDLSRIKLEGRYSVAGERRDLLSPVESGRAWSDLILETDTWLTRTMQLRFDARYDHYESELSSASAGFDYDDSQGNSIGASYQMARATVEYFEGHLATKMFSPFTLGYTARYSFDRSAFLESVYSAEYRQKCWSVNVAIHQRPDDQAYSINFNLAGLGSK
jgi:LPS-assembly protein